MKFTRENYEEYVLDWLEGKLSGPGRELFLKFLEENPDIYEEIEAAGKVRLEPSDALFHDKNILKKNISLSKSGPAFENLCVAFLEGDLEPAEKQKFESSLSENPDKLIEFELFRKSRLKPDSRIIFEPKSGLKRLSVYQKRVRIFSTAAAAAIAVMIIIFSGKTGLFNPDLITVADSNLKIPSGKEIINEKVVPDINNGQIADNQLIRTEKKLQGKDASDLNYIKTLEYRDTGSDISGADIKPLSARFSLVDNVYSTDLNKLKSEEREPSWKFDSYLALGEFAGSKILQNIFPENEAFRQDKLTFWDLASTGFEGLNQVSDGGYSLNRDIDKNGKIKRISIETPLLGISIPLKNKQPQ
jgi:hypothetical protein